uniref:C2 domain-containing protein n=1 Tax=Kalanchoe fedtschenkoi TaxID=63787 RepID=A0A7N1A4A2_KALFE
MLYLYVYVVIAKDLPGKDVTGSCDPYVEVKLGNYKGTTRHFEKKTALQASVLEVTVKDKDFVEDDFMGRVLVDLNEVPKRVPPDTFPEAWHSDAAAVSGADGLTNIRSKVYLSPTWNRHCSPTLWYLRVNVIEAQDLLPSDKGRFPKVYVKATLGNQILLDHKVLNTRWFNLEKHIIAEGGEKKETKFASRIHMCICLEGGYHVLDESTHYSSDLRPTAKQLWKSITGVLEAGIMNVTGLMPIKNKDGRGTTDAYCVAKYGQKWVRKRIILDSSMPKWNQQFTCLSLLNMMHMYSLPLLPKMHYIHPLTVSQLNSLRHQATQIVLMRLSRAEPPLRKEFIEYMLDVGSHMWSMRRSKANFFRIMGMLGRVIAVAKWFDQICHRKNPITTILIHILTLSSRFNLLAYLVAEVYACLFPLSNGSSGARSGGNGGGLPYSRCTNLPFLDP